jgi:hypothetical protein
MTFSFNLRILGSFLEAASGFEPLNKGFADCNLQYPSSNAIIHMISEHAVFT